MWAILLSTFSVLMADIEGLFTESWGDKSGYLLIESAKGESGR